MIVYVYIFLATLIAIRIGRPLIRLNFLGQARTVTGKREVKIGVVEHL